MTQEQLALLGALVGLARAMDGIEQAPSAHRAMAAGLRALAEGPIAPALDAARQEKRRAVPDCYVCQNPCGRTDDWDAHDLEKLEPALREAKEALLAALIRFARQEELPPQAPELITGGLFSLGYEWFTREEIEEKTHTLEKEIRV